jgi:cytochrome b
MAAAPAQYNIRPQRRADFPLSLRFKDSDGVVINLTGWTVLASVWKTDRSAKLGDFTVTVATPATGEVALKLAYSVTASLPDECRYDVMLVAPSGLREYYVEGIVRPSEGYTVPA